MNDLLVQGLTISALGLGLTFAALGLFILVIVALRGLFTPRPKAAARPAERGEAGKPTTEPAARAPSRDTEGQEIAAAILIALSHLRSHDICESGLGQALQAGRGPWWHQNAGARLIFIERPDRGGGR
jgi:sodium pump decarboxylase gamma subunit